jgi:hypothetical protein
MKSLTELIRNVGVAGLAALAILFGTMAVPAFAAPGTTLAAEKTLDICVVGEGIWRYSGEIAVWNSGAVDTSGLAIKDCIQNKGSGPLWTNAYCDPTFQPDPTNYPIEKGTTLETATIFKYSLEGAPLPGDIRNDAKVTILNHSGHVGTPWGPEPKATWTGGTPKACEQECGCTYTQGYWGNKPGVVWPGPYDRNATFYQSGQTWQQVLDTSVNVSQGYYQLAHQYIAAVLNFANGACQPQGVKDVLNDASNWLTNNAPSACTAKGSCGQQKDWAAELATYNEGTYPGGPSHCGDE